MAMNTLKNFRDKKLAHSLLDAVLDAAPKYNELFLLLDVASEVARCSKLVVSGTNIDFDEFEREWRRDARAFWEPAIAAASANQERIRP